MRGVFSKRAGLHGDSQTQPPEHTRQTFLRFVLAGFANTAFGFLVYGVCIVAGLPIPLALLIGNILGLGFNFVTLGGYAFRDLSWRRVPRFALAYCALLLFNWLLIRLLMPAAAIGPIAAQCVLLVPMALTSYLLMAHWVFKRSTPRA